jgi:hypothetical protein
MIIEPSNLPPGSHCYMVCNPLNIAFRKQFYEANTDYKYRKRDSRIFDNGEQIAKRTWEESKTISIAEPAAY